MCGLTKEELGLILQDECPPLKFECGGFFSSVFKKPVMVEGQLVQSGPESIRERILLVLAGKPLGRSLLAEALGHKGVSGKLKMRMKELMEDGLIEYTIPEKPNSRLQKYRLTEKGKRVFKGI